MKLSTIVGLPHRPILAMAVLVASAATGACSSASPSGTGPTGPDTGAPASDKDSGAPRPKKDSGAPRPKKDSGSPEAGAESGAPKPATAFFRGALARSAADSKSFSDPFFTGVEGEAMGAGDNGHDALLGTTNLGTTLDQFVGLDTWSTDQNMDAVYSNPMVLAFGKSFYAAPPEFVTFYPTDFYQWGNTDSADGSTPHYFVMIRGRYSDTPDKIKPLHDPIAKGIQTQSTTAGEVAHIVYAGRKDPLDALIVDVWTSNANIDSFYSSAELKSSLSSLFDATGPNYGVYGSTDWVTW